MKKKNGHSSRKKYSPVTANITGRQPANQEAEKIRRSTGDDRPAERKKKREQKGGKADKKAEKRRDEKERDLLSPD